MSDTPMRRLFLLAIMLTGLVSGSLVAPAAAQETATPTAAGNATGATGETIDQNTVLLNSSYDGAKGTVSVTIRSETLQQITVTDAGAFMEGGEIARRTVTVRPDQPTTIEIPATEYQGSVGVSIATASTLYAEPIEVRDAWFQGDSTWTDTQAAGAGSALGVLLVVAALAWRRRDGGQEEVRRRA